MNTGRPPTKLVVTAIAGGLAAAGFLWGYFGSLDARCRRGDGTACGVLADRERHASKGQGDLTHVCDLYRRACTGGNDGGCSNLGAWLAQGKCTGAPGEALAVLERACDHGHTPGCNNLGMLLRDGAAGAAIDKARAAALFRKACEHTAVACDNLGVLLLDTDEAAATAAFRAGCEKQEDGEDGARCCYKLGLAHASGWGIPVDVARARKLYAQTCERVAAACNSLGLLEVNDPDPAVKTRAAGHFRDACDRGEAGACNNLGLMYAQGIGVPRDAARAAELLAKACEGGDLRACANLGSRLERGDGVARDPARGRALVERACKGGVAEACVPPVP